MTSNDQLQAFRKIHTILHKTIGGHQWSYISSGSGSQTVLILPGGGGNDDIGAELMFPIIIAFESNARVISVGYPSTAKTVEDIIEGIKTILDQEHIDTVSILGHSAGGMFAQAFMMKYPLRTQGLIIANSAIYSSLKRKIILKLLRPFIARLLERRMKKSIGHSFERLLKDEPEKSFWVPYLTKGAINLPPNGFANNYQCMLDFAENYKVTRGKIQAWGGRTLILESDNDTGFTMTERKDLRALYSEATVHIFKGAGHLSFITQTKNFTDVIKYFLFYKEVAA